MLKKGKSFRSVEWFKDRIENLEDAFVKLLWEKIVFTQDGYVGSLSSEECKLMDDILELKDWLNDLLETKDWLEEEKKGNMIKGLNNVVVDLKEEEEATGWEDEEHFEEETDVL